MKWMIIFLIVSLAPLFSASQVSAKVQSLKPNIKPNKKNETPWMENLKLSAKIFRQADAVAREMWWVAANDRKPIHQSPFGRIYRALMKEIGKPLPKGLSFKCDSYKVTNLANVERPLKLEIYEACNLKNNLLIATWTLDLENNLQVDFYPTNLANDLGLISALVNKKIHCDLRFIGSQLKTMKCQNWAQDRSKTQVIELSTFNYTADKEEILEIKGVVLEDLNPKSKIEVKVPMAGKIIVIEKEIEEKILKLGEPKKPNNIEAGLPEPEYIPHNKPEPSVR